MYGGKVPISWYRRMSTDWVIADFDPGLQWTIGTDATTQHPPCSERYESVVAR
jgi:hypothetical protein